LSIEESDEEEPEAAAAARAVLENQIKLLLQNFLCASLSHLLRYLQSNPRPSHPPFSFGFLHVSCVMTRKLYGSFFREHPPEGITRSKAPTLLHFVVFFSLAMNAVDTCWVSQKNKRRAPGY
jgi:hypothetical protein